MKYLEYTLLDCAVKAHQFFTDENWGSFKQIFDTYMLHASKEWVETNEGSPLVDTLGSIWSFNFFFYNRKLKRVVSFHFYCISNLVADGFPTDELDYDEDEEIFDGMDMLVNKLQKREKLKASMLNRTFMVFILKVNNQERIKHLRGRHTTYYIIFQETHTFYQEELLQVVERHLEEPNVEQLCLTDLVQFEKQLDAALIQTRSRKLGKWVCSCNWAEYVQGPVSRFL
ncbi:hypothetical protein F0562_033425 [Nyssa sinensis]|uniref:Uncharacterized protein n=1 Tax=Nyssa sinensis TaxID=561372 RepID=A0A5J5AI17_9ASTE|nr:hypothetical protein F0562_033425 [Nyssa sinensis]